MTKENEMDELKVGDRVRITFLGPHNGREGVFTGMDEERPEVFCFTLDRGYKSKWANRDSFEIIKPATPATPATPALPQFKPGDRVIVARADRECAAGWNAEDMDIFLPGRLMHEGMTIARESRTFPSHYVMRDNTFIWPAASLELVTEDAAHPPRVIETKAVAERLPCPLDPTPGWTLQQEAKRQLRLANILLGREVRQQRGLLLRVPSGVVHKHWSDDE